MHEKVEAEGCITGQMFGTWWCSKVGLARAASGFAVRAGETKRRGSCWMGDRMTQRERLPGRSPAAPSASRLPGMTRLAGGKAERP